MSERYDTNFELATSILVGASIQLLPNNPINPVEGQVYKNTNDNHVYFYDGLNWIDLSGGSVPISGGGGGTTTVTRSSFSTSIGDGTSTEIIVTHNLGTKDLVVTVRESNVTGEKVYPDIRFTTVDSITLVFDTPPSPSQYRIAVIS